MLLAIGTSYAGSLPEKGISQHDPYIIPIVIRTLAFGSLKDRILGSSIDFG